MEQEPGLGKSLKEILKWKRPYEEEDDPLDWTYEVEMGINAKLNEELQSRIAFAFATMMVSWGLRNRIRTDVLSRWYEP